MKHYIEAYYSDGRQILGMGSGQTVLRGMREPARSAAWRRVLTFSRSTPEPWKGATRWHLVTEQGTVLAVHSIA